MKKMRRFISFMLAMVMVLAMGMSAMAASIEVKEVIDGETYTAYKILNYTDNGKTGEDRAVSYYLLSAEYTSIGTVLEAAGFAFTASADGTQYYLNNAETLDVGTAAASLANNVASLGNALGKFSAVGFNGKAEFTDLAIGYYFVTSSAGSLCALHENTEIATVVEKNTVTTPDKKQGEEAGTYSDEQLDMNIGDTVYYVAEIKIGKGANYAINAKDTLSEGLTLNHAEGQITVKVGADTVGKSDDTYTLTINDDGFEIVFKADYVASLSENDIIKIEYSAVINEDAVIRGENTNTFEIDYLKQHFEKTTVVKTYDVKLYKKDGEGQEANSLAGAKFNVFKQESGGTALTFKSDAKGYYLDAAGDKEIDAGDGTGVNIRGLEPGDYWFEETEAPAGYNKLDKRVKVTVTKNANAEAEIIVVNEQGAVLPSTGGVGTTMFYVIGGALVLVAVVLLVTRKRMSVEK